MSFSDEQLNAIFDRTDGRCHICRKKLAWKNYGVPGARGAWEVDHSQVRAKGGTDRINNLYAACVACNREKGAGTTRAARARKGYRHAPLPRAEKERRRKKNAIGGGVVGAGLGSLAGPAGAVVGAIVGAAIGHDQDPEDD